MRNIRSLLGAASIITRLSDIVTVPDPKGTSTKLGTGISRCAENGRVAAPGGKESQWCKTAPHAGRVGLILPFKESSGCPKAMNSGNV